MVIGRNLNNKLHKYLLIQYPTNKSHIVIFHVKANTCDCNLVCIYDFLIICNFTIFTNFHLNWRKGAAPETLQVPSSKLVPNILLYLATYHIFYTRKLFSKITKMSPPEKLMKNFFYSFTQFYSTICLFDILFYYFIDLRKYKY